MSRANLAGCGVEGLVGRVAALLLLGGALSALVEGRLLLILRCILKSEN